MGHEVTVETCLRLEREHLAALAVEAAKVAQYAGQALLALGYEPVSVLASERAGKAIRQAERCHGYAETSLRSLGYWRAERARLELEASGGA
jgi:hypothetical protein